MPTFAAVVLAGGSARRMGGALKPTLLVGGLALLSRVLTTVAGADPIVVVGPDSLAPLLPATVRLTREDPPGGGPVAAAHAGLTALARTGEVVHSRTGGTGAAGTGTTVALLAADLPFLSAAVVQRLHAELIASGADGAVLVDDDDRPQWLCGVWRVDALGPRLATAPAGASLRSTVDGLRIRPVSVAGPATTAAPAVVAGPAAGGPAAAASPRSGPPAWFDCDTEADLRAAEEWF